MIKRAAGGVLWFLAIWTAYEFLWALTGVPHDLGPLLGLMAAVIVVVDPTSRIWGHPIVLNIGPRRSYALRRAATTLESVPDA